ncbi:GNAT family N-acetyltransferase [Streptomyces sp. NPDC050504]|uniref:GNAT family N-acetyltransferase n=1 Tax=Streptomyces sp. NPDC050504 TaxID=3365618 RepID=UPI003791545C
MITDVREIGDGVLMRLAALSDAPAVADALVRNREYMAPWEPVRPEEFYTGAGQRARLSMLLRGLEAGVGASWVLVDGDRVVGGFTLSGISLGYFRSGQLGYWVDKEYAGRGLATAAVRAVCETARDDLLLHRVEAGTLLDNTASQRVLAKCGFESYGVAPKYLYIAGDWRDNRLFQRLLHDGPPR